MKDERMYLRISTANKAFIKNIAEKNFDGEYSKVLEYMICKLKNCYDNEGNEKKVCKK